jgi:hypothetical protein
MLMLCGTSTKWGGRVTASSGSPVADVELADVELGGPEVEVVLAGRLLGWVMGGSGADLPICEAR